MEEVMEAQINHINAHEAREKIARGALVIHTLPADHFQCAHLPGARNACVYQVSFLNDIKAIVDKREQPLVLYGSSPHSLDAEAAAEKLLREGFSQVYVLQGGLEAWQAAGLPVEGKGALLPDPATHLPKVDGEYQLDTGSSLVGWTGRNQNNKHFGTLKFKNGHIRVQNSEISGQLVVDMDSLENLNLEGNELQPVLIAHLKSDDFFFTQLFPTATFTIEGGRLDDAATLTAANCLLKGALTLRAVSKELEFPATITPRANGSLGLEAHFDMDRTQWNIIYGSSHFFEHLGMHTVFDAISIELRLVLEPLK
jgi:rhodanese-related sulfurtransferase